jgi:ribonucleotide monophosphatase NagD (HAD superfamily)
MNKAPTTLILDLDGCIVENKNRDIFEQLDIDLVLLPGVREKIKAWDRAGCKIYVFTGRTEGSRARTEEQLKKLNIPYTQLVMGSGGGPRVLINDSKPDGRRTAFAYSIQPNVGFGDIEIEDLVQHNPYQKDKMVSDAIGGL